MQHALIKCTRQTLRGTINIPTSFDQVGDPPSGVITLILLLVVNRQLRMCSLVRLNRLTEVDMLER